MKHAAPGLSLLAFLFLVVFAVFLIAAPPPPLPRTAPETVFSAERALEHLVHFAQEPRPIGSEAHDRAREYLMEALGGLGLEPEIQDTTVVRQAGSSNIAARVRNILARLEGTASTGAVLLVAHYDSVSTGPGASDNGSGVVTILETVRALRAGAPLRNDLMVLFTDAEESGLLGAEAFVTQHAWAQEVSLVLNFEARGMAGPVWMFETSPDYAFLVQRLDRTVARPLASSAAGEIYRRMPNDTDLSRFLAGGLRGMNFAYIEGVTHYHTRLDNIENINPASVQHQGTYALTLARDFGNADFTAVHWHGEPVYFSVAGRQLVRYSTGVATGLVFLAGILFLILVVFGLSRQLMGPAGIIGGFLGLPLCVILAAVANTAAWAVLWILHDDYRWMPFDHPYSTQLLFYVFLGISLGVSLALFASWLGKSRPAGLAAGAFLFWLLLAALVTFYAPNFSYLLIWPLLFNMAALGVLLWLSRDLGRDSRTGRFPAPGWSSAGILALGAVPGLMLVVQTVHQAYIALPQYLVGLLMAPAVLLVGLLIPQWALIIRSDRWAYSIIPLGLAVVFWIAATTLYRFSPEYPKPNSIFYGLMADAEVGVWASTDDEVDEWTRQFLGDDPSVGRWNDFTLGAGPRVLRGVAPMADLAPPMMAVVSRRREGETVEISLQLRSRRGAPHLAFEIIPAGAVQAATLEGRPLSVEGNWGAVYFAAPPEGIRIELSADANRSFRIRVIDQSYGLPAFPEFDYRPRPPDMMPTAEWSGLQDATMVVTSHTF